MISKKELADIAEAKRISLKNAEKDYLLEAILFVIFSEAGDSFIFKGGTALYKFYSLNRFSEDLDFTMNRRRADIHRTIDVVLRRLSALGIGGKSQIKAYGNETNARLFFRGPLYDGRKESMAYVAINCSRRERPLTSKREFFVPSYREIPSFDVFVMGAEEMLAEKVRAVMTRDKARDVYDLWFLLKRGVRPNPIFIGKKLKIYRTGVSLGKFVASIEEKRGSWERDLRGLVIGSLPEFSQVKDYITKNFVYRT